jgi:hypothetical protein
MATLAVIVAGAIACTVAFTGSQAVYAAVHGGADPEKEQNKHDKAVEDLSKATAEWAENRQKALDFINR